MFVLDTDTLSLLFRGHVQVTDRVGQATREVVLTVITWIRFVVWLAIGLLIYFFYSRHNSEFARGNR